MWVTQIKILKKKKKVDIDVLKDDANEKKEIDANDKRLILTFRDFYINNLTFNEI